MHLRIRLLAQNPCRLQMVAWETTPKTEPVAISIKRATSGRDERELSLTNRDPPCTRLVRQMYEPCTSHAVARRSGRAGCVSLRRGWALNLALFGLLILGQPPSTLGMKPTITALWTTALVLLCQLSASAWSGAGHEVIAAEAYRELSAGLQKKVVHILEAHPQYARWKEFLRDDAGSPEAGMQIFMRASTWPDEIRRRESEYNHPRWHFIDYPLKPPKFPLLPDSTPNDDIVYAIQLCEQTLSNGKGSAEERAVFLSWLIHLVGDVHQPLHCSSWFDREHPNGDKGGNDFFIKPGARGISLHSFWDGLLGTSGSPRSHVNYAIAIGSEHRRKSLKELKKARTPREWSLQCRAAAIESVYLGGELQGSLSREDAPDLPEGYTKEAKAVGERQAALAGYRLADEIRKWVK
jgi:hypothetical protein